MAIGNSDGDLEMLQYVNDNNHYPKSLLLLVHHDYYSIVITTTMTDYRKMYTKVIIIAYIGKFYEYFS
jgi:hypothetical protein